MQRRQYITTLVVSVGSAGCLRFQQTTTDTESAAAAPSTKTDTRRRTDTSILSPNPDREQIIDREITLPGGQYGDWPLEYSEQGVLLAEYSVRAGIACTGLVLEESELENFEPGKSTQFDAIHETKDRRYSKTRIELSPGSYVYILIPSLSETTRVKVNLVKLE